ncbi:MAG: peptidoglycan-binding protein [Flavobacteriales bacterium]|nr:peptidoglycan-binding protein [Flavobacteriales bacterium]
MTGTPVSPTTSTPLPEGAAGLARSTQTARTHANVSAGAPVASSPGTTRTSTTPLANPATAALAAPPDGATVSRGGLPRAPSLDATRSPMDLGGPVGPGLSPTGTGRERGNDPGDVRRVQQRLADVGLYHGPVDGAFSDDTETALRDFQHTHGPDIRAIQADGRATGMVRREDDEAVSRYASPVQASSRPGTITPGDATHQALVQAWPHVVAGRLMDEPQAYQYYADQVRARGLTFDESRPNVIGVRGYSGGFPHPNNGSATRANEYNDTMAVLTRDASGAPHVREYRATMDPGGRERAGDGVDSRGWAMDANQQGVWRLETPEHNTDHAGRPGLQWQQGVSVSPDGTGPSHLTATGVDGASRNEDGHIMLHSGDSGDTVRGSSLGCQVVQGNWYPGFYGTLSRASESTDGRVNYTLLDGEELTPP